MAVDLLKNFMKHLFSIFFMFCSTIVYSQNETEPSILSAHENWRKEVIKFPIEWAPNLKLKGFEELRFAPAWSDPESDQFWSTVMAWKVNASNKLTKQEIENNFEAYFDGLMKPNHWATTFPRPTVLFIPNPEKEEPQLLIGKMKFFDGFHTGKLMTQNIKVEQHFCETTNKAIILFRFSPMNFDHPIWEKLNNIIRKPTSCE